MAFDVANIGGLIIGWLLNPLIWILIVFFVVAFTWGILLIRRRRKLIYNCAEIVTYSEDGEKFGINIIKCGWFGKKKWLKGLWDTGEEQIETKDKDIVYEFSTEDFQEINGKRGVVCYRDPINQNILVPISKATIVNKEFLGAIAPADFRDVALSIIEDADRETADWKDKIIQFVMWGLVVVFSLVSIIVVAQMVKNGQTEASKLIVEAGQTCLQNAKEVCSQIATSAASNAP